MKAIPLESLHIHQRDPVGKHLRLGIDRCFTRCIERNIEGAALADEVDGIGGFVAVKFSDGRKVVLTAVEDKPAPRFDHIT